MNERFSVKDVFDFTLTPIGGGTPIVINYLNNCSISWEEESVAAMEKGYESIIFKKPKTGELTVDAQVVGEDYLALAFGGTKVGTKITVGAMSPNTAYSATGTFTVTEKGGIDKKKKITLPSLTPVANGELSVSGDDIANFGITFKILPIDGVFFTWDNDATVLADK